MRRGFPEKCKQNAFTIDRQTGVWKDEAAEHGKKFSTILEMGLNEWELLRPPPKEKVPLTGRT